MMISTYTVNFCCLWKRLLTAVFLQITFSPSSFVLEIGYRSRGMAEVKRIKRFQPKRTCAQRGIKGLNRNIANDYMFNPQSHFRYPLQSHTAVHSALRKGKHAVRSSLPHIPQRPQAEVTESPGSSSRRRTGRRVPEA